MAVIDKHVGRVLAILGWETATTGTSADCPPTRRCAGTCGGPRTGTGFSRMRYARDSTATGESTAG